MQIENIAVVTTATYRNLQCKRGVLPGNGMGG